MATVRLAAVGYSVCIVDAPFTSPVDERLATTIVGGQYPTAALFRIDNPPIACPIINSNDI